MSDMQDRSEAERLEDEAAAEPIDTALDPEKKRAESREDDIPVDDLDAESRPAFGDDGITPHLNDGR